MAPPERSKMCMLLLQLVQCPDQPLAALCGCLVPVVPRPLLNHWAGRLGQMKEEGVAGTMDLFQVVWRIFITSFSVQ